MSEGFILLAEDAEEFFKLCHTYNITDHDKRLQVLRLFVKNKKAKYVRDPEELIKGKKVLRVKKIDGMGQ